MFEVSFMHTDDPYVYDLNDRAQTRKLLEDELACAPAARGRGYIVLSSVGQVKIESEPMRPASKKKCPVNVRLPVLRNGRAFEGGRSTDRAS